MQGCLKRLPLAVLRQLLGFGLPIKQAVHYGITSIGRIASVGRGARPSFISDMTDSRVACRKFSDEINAGHNFGQPSKKLRNWMWGGGYLELPSRAARPQAPRSCSLLGYGLAVPEDYKASQVEIAEMLGVSPTDKRHWAILTADHIKTRYLAELAQDLNDPSSVGMQRLHEKHIKWATRLLVEAIGKALQDAGVDPAQVAHISIVNSTGFLLPGLTAWLLKDGTVGIPATVSRQDIIGMGCHAGLNSLKSAGAWAAANPGKIALSCGVEVCSAQYVWGDLSQKQLNNVIVNSLFGDGCFCAVLRAPILDEDFTPPAYLDMPPQWWAQLCDSSALDDMIYRPELSEGKFRFDLSELAPYHVGLGLFTLMSQSLMHNIPVHYADHVVVHTGGKTVLDCSAVALGLEGPPKVTLPYTVEALQDYGNQSSCSIMFAFHNLVKHGNVNEGDCGLFVTMGPGAGLEMALWTAGKRFCQDEATPRRRMSSTWTVDLRIDDDGDDFIFSADQLEFSSADLILRTGEDLIFPADPPVEDVSLPICRTLVIAAAAACVLLATTARRR